jgi:hypothetical protein
VKYLVEQCRFKSQKCHGRKTVAVKLEDNTWLIFNKNSSIFILIR